MWQLYLSILSGILGCILGCIVNWFLSQTCQPILLTLKRHTKNIQLVTTLITPLFSSWVIMLFPEFTLVSLPPVSNSQMMLLKYNLVSPLHKILS